MSKLAILLLIAVLVLSGLVMVGSAFAQSTAKPSVPEFTLELEEIRLNLRIRNQPNVSY